MSSRRCHRTARKTLTYTAVTAVLALLTWTVVPAPTYTYVVRELSQTFTAVQTFSAGLALTGTGTGSGSLHLDGGIGATDGNKVNLEGLSGDTYLKRDPSTGFIFVYRDGSLKATITGNGVIPGACPTNIYTMEGGTQCYDTATGLTMTFDQRGVHEVGQ